MFHIRISISLISSLFKRQKTLPLVSGKPAICCIKIDTIEIGRERRFKTKFFKVHLKKFRFKSSFSTYLYRINLNTANSWFTRNKWKSFLSLEKAADKGYRDTNVEHEWNRKELWSEISKLPKKQRSVVIMRIAEELSYKEISKITGMAEGSAKVNFHHALKTLKQRLNHD